MTWAVGDCLTGQALLLATRLANDGFDAYTPSRHLETSPVPKEVYPGYFFLRSGEGDEGLVSLMGYARRKWDLWFGILQSGGRFGRIDEEFIEALKRREAEDGFKEEMEITCRQYSIGERVYIKNSGYAGLTAIVLGFRGKRAKLEIPGFEEVEHWFPTTLLQPHGNSV